MPTTQARKSYIGSFGDVWPIPAVAFQDASMTAIGVNGTNDGFIIVADGRRSVDDASKAATPDKAKAREGRDARKIFPLRGPDKNIAYALAGYVVSDDPPFDAVQECSRLAQIFSQRDYANEMNLVNGFSKALTESMNQAKQFPEFEKNSDDYWKIMDAVFVGYLKAVPFVTYVEFSHSLRFAEFHSKPLPLAGILYGSKVIRRAM